MMVKFNNNKPIYLQIVDDIIAKILSNQIQLGDKLPSVRDLAIEYTVNPNTIQKVISELDSHNLIRIERGKGTYITLDKGVIETMKEKTINEELEHFINRLITMGLSHSDIIELINSNLENRGDNYEN